MFPHPLHVWLFGCAGAYEYLEKITKRLIDGILAAAKETGHPMCGGNISGMFGFFFCEGPVSCFEDAKAAGGQAVQQVWLGAGGRQAWGLGGNHKRPWVVTGAGMRQGHCSAAGMPGCGCSSGWGVARSPVHDAQLVGHVGGCSAPRTLCCGSVGMHATSTSKFFNACPSLISCSLPPSTH